MFSQFSKTMSTPNPFAASVPPANPFAASAPAANPFAASAPASNPFAASAPAANPFAAPSPQTQATSAPANNPFALRQPTTPATPAFPSMTTPAPSLWPGVPGLTTTAPPTTQAPSATSLWPTTFPQAGPTASAVTTEGVTFDTPYKDLPVHYKTEVDRTFSEFKQPQKLAIASIAKSKGAAFDEMKDHLRTLHLSVLKVENQQLELQRNIRPFLEEIKHLSRDVRISGTNGIQQLKQKSSALAAYGRSAGGIVIDENLPNSFFVAAAERLEARLSVCAEGVRYFAHQLQAKISALDRTNPASVAGQNMYGQVMRIGASQLLEVLRDQNEAFMRVAGSVAEVHRATEELRTIFLQLMNSPNSSMNYNNNRSNYSSGYYGGNQVAMSNRGAMNSAAAAAGLNPFELADRKEAADKRVLLQKLRNESLRHMQEHPQQQNGAAAGAKPGPATGLGTGTAGSTLLNTIPSATTAPPAAGANPFAAANPFASTGATPATNPNPFAAPGATTGGFAASMMPSTDNLMGINTMAARKSTKKR